jgi:hypothetical protein
VIGAVYNLVVSFVMYGPQINPNYSILYPMLVLQDSQLRLFLPIVSVLQIFVAFEVARGGYWSYYGGLAVTTLDAGVFLGFAYLYYTAPNLQTNQTSLQSPLLQLSLVLNVAFAAIVWVYFNKPNVANYLKRWW